MSSEESDPGDTTEERSRGPKPRKIKKLSWERSKLKNIKEILDECYLSGLNAKQRRTSAHVSRYDKVSPRPCPVDGPRWAVCSQYRVSEDLLLMLIHLCIGIFRLVLRYEFGVFFFQLLLCNEINQHSNTNSGNNCQHVTSKT